MSVSALSAVTLREYKDSMKQVLGVDGYFHGSQTVTGDGSGGQVRVTLEEPDDATLQFRALKIMAWRASKTSGAVDTGDLFIVSKTLQNSDMYIPLQGRTVRSGVTTVQYSGLIDDVGVVLRNRDWFVPSYPTSVQSELEIICEWDNDAGAPTWTMTVFGYYLRVE